MKNELDQELLNEITEKEPNPIRPSKPAGSLSLHDVVGLLGYNLKNGSNKCPFHPDKNPSFSIDFDKGVFNCFGCDAKGRNPVTFVMLARDCSKEEAIDWLKQHNPTQPDATQRNPTPPNTTQHNPIQPNTTNNNIERDFLVKSILSKERPTIHQLKYGIHQGKFYYGTVVFQGEKPIQAVVTSEREIFLDAGEENEIKKQFGLFYRYGFNYEILDSHISTKAISDWLFEEKNPPTIAELFEALVNLNKKYMIYPKDETHKVVALDILSSYFLPCFEAKGRTFIEADKGSGKTRQCSIINLLSCNSVMSPDITKASFFRLMESSVGTLVIDDFDSIRDEQKEDVLQHYKTGYKNTSKAIRTGESNRNQREQEAFRNYGHVVMNNTSGLDSISQDRTIYLPILKVAGEEADRTLNTTAKHWGLLRDDLYLGGLSYWRLVKEVYDSFSSPDFSGRKLEIVRPLLSIASLVSDELLSEVVTWLKDMFERFHTESEEDTRTLFIIKKFLDEEAEQYTINSLAVELAIEEGFAVGHNQHESKKHAIAIWIGKRFRTIPGVFKFVTIQGRRTLRLLDREKLSSWLDTLGWRWVALGDVGSVPPVESRVRTENVEEELKDYLMVQRRIGDVIAKYDEELINKLLQEGTIAEYRKGYYGVVD